MERSQAPKILRLVPDSMFVFFLCPFFAYTLSIFFLFLSFILSQGLQGPTCASLAHYRRANRAHYTWGLLTEKLNCLSGLHALHMCYSSACTFSSPLYASIWLKFWPRWVAWILYLCPTFPLIRLGHKGSTSAIVTAGSAECVPQTGWSRKLAFLREYSVGEQKMIFIYFPYVPPDVFSCVSSRSPDMHFRACVPRERNP